MTEQLDLFSTRDTERADPRPLIEALRGRGWMRAADLARALRANDRRIRQLANLAAGRVISGQQGYKLTAEATMEEIDRASAWLRSQAKEMTHRALQIDRVYHARSA